MLDGAILEKNDLYYREFIAENGKKLIIVEPGYIINQQAFMIWKMMDSPIKFENLLALIQDYFPKIEYFELKKILISVLTNFIKRRMIKATNLSSENLGTISEDSNTEVNLLNNYATTIVTQIDMVITTGCNFRCRHCFIKGSSYVNDITLDVDKWKEIINKLCNYGLMSVVITGGEPLVYQHLPELLDYINDVGLKIQLLTNGYLLNDEFIKRISKYRNVSVQVSLDGSNSETNNFQRNMLDAYEKTVSNIRILRKYNISVTIAMVLNKRNIKDLYDNSMFELCTELDVNVLGITPTVISFENALKNNDDFLEPGLVSIM